MTNYSRRLVVKSTLINFFFSRIISVVITYFCSSAYLIIKIKLSKILRTTQEDNRLIASLAVFRELYDSEKDVYGVISVFLNEIIKNKALFSFTLIEITSLLNKGYEFDIPPAVVSTALNRLHFIERDQGKFFVKTVDQISFTKVDAKQSAITANNETIIERLYQYIETQKGISLVESERKIITHSFSCFLLDENNGNQYIEFITSFILANESDVKFKSQLNLIREGVILYSGIKYNNDLNDIGTWRNELTIFIETEILFHLAGYNGELYKMLVLNFFSYVTEINQKAGKRIINFKYFPEIKSEIDGFFTKAKYLVENSTPPNPKTTAMVTLVNGCQKPSDIMEKKSDFFSLLNTFHITIDTFDKYFVEENHKYNIINQEIIDKISNEIDRDANEYLEPLNFVAIQRKDASTYDFENCKAILLTGNSLTLRVAWNEGLKDKGEVPLATHLSFLTNKFWFKLNKGFGVSDLPKSFDIITKAQIVLSKVLNDTVGEKYTELNEKLKAGILTPEQAKSRILLLRNQAKKPEEIRNEIVSEVIHTITEDSLQKFLEEQSYADLQAKNNISENENLKVQIQNSKNEKKQEALNSNAALLAEKNKYLKSLLAQKTSLDKKSKKAFRLFKRTLCAIIIIYAVIALAVIFTYGWDKFEPYVFIIFAIFPFIGTSIYLIITEKSFSPLEFLSTRKNLYYVETYKEFDFDVEKIELTRKEIFSLEKRNVE